MTEQEWRDRFAFILRKKMRNKNMTQRELADAADISEVAVSNYIKGKRTPRADYIVKMANALECSTDELIQFNEYTY